MSYATEATYTMLTLRKPACCTGGGKNADKRAPLQMPVVDYPDPCICQGF